MTVPYPDAEFTVTSARDREVARLISNLVGTIREYETREEVDEVLGWLAGEFLSAARGQVERLAFCFGPEASMESFPRRFTRE